MLRVNGYKYDIILHPANPCTWIFPSINCEDLNPEILDLIAKNKIPQQILYKNIDILAKASFGFGDVNACIIFKKYKNV